MNKNEAFDLAHDLSNIATDILAQLDGLELKHNNLEDYFLGLLNRAKLILHDISIILKINHDTESVSALILLRVLLDDFIRALSIYSSGDRENQLVLIQANALEHIIKSTKENAYINSTLFQDTNSTISTQQDYDDILHRILNDPTFDNYFSDKNNIPIPKFKSPTAIGNIFKHLMRDNDYAAASIHSYVLYKELSRHVHYANFSFPYPNEQVQKELENNMLEEAFFYCYKMLLVYCSFFAKTYTIVWNDKRVTAYFFERTSMN